MEESNIEAFERYLNENIERSCKILEGKGAVEINSIADYKYQLSRLMALEQVLSAFKSFRSSGNSGEYLE